MGMNSRGIQQEDALGKQWWSWLCNIPTLVGQRATTDILSYVAEPQSDKKSK